MRNKEPDFVELKGQTWEIQMTSNTPASSYLSLLAFSRRWFRDLKPQLLLVDWALLP